ncbi:hypothetical protein V500_01163, partial [Pseudogymnoascus sp. VKM F-4518 (FW-2643)]
YNELLATIATVENSELEDRLKKAYAIDECAKRVLTKVEGDFAINEQGLIRYKGLVYKEASRDSGIFFDSILVITERLTKYRKFVPYLEASSAEQLAYTFIRIVLADYRLLDEIILDRDKLFTSKFWRSLMALIGTNYKLSTAFYP